MTVSRPDDKQPVTALSAEAHGAAQRLWARAGGESTAPEAVAAAAQRVGIQLRAGLSRWIGTDGYRVLLLRAVALTRAQHPVLIEYASLGADEPVSTEAVAAQGAGSVATGLVALVTVLIELLGRIIGRDMAVRLVDQIELTQGPALMSGKGEKRES